MARRCIVCGKKIRTGIKYCSIHRGSSNSFSPYSSESLKFRKYNSNFLSDLFFISLLISAIGIWIYFFNVFLSVLIIVFGVSLFIFYLFEKEGTEKKVFFNYLRNKEKKKNWEIEYFLKK